MVHFEIFAPGENPGPRGSGGPFGSIWSKLGIEWNSLVESLASDLR